MKPPINPSHPCLAAHATAARSIQPSRQQFSKVEVHIFENPLVFEEVEPFLAYTRASLSEDRRLWKDLFENAGGFEQVMQEIKIVASASAWPRMASW